MLWPAILTASVTPIDTATGSITTYVLGFGPIGIICLAFAFRFIVPKSAVEDARQIARIDLEKENERLLAEKRRAEEQRDEALQAVSSQMVPLLQSFVTTTSTLIPLLQEVVVVRRRGGDGPDGQLR